MKRFDIVTALLTLAARIHAKRIECMKVREARLRQAMEAASVALVATQRERQEAEKIQIHPVRQTGA